MNLKKYLKQHGISQQEFARMLGIKTQAAVSQWLLKNRIPAERVLQIEAATGGIVTRHDLRPDLYPRE